MGTAADIETVLGRDLDIVTYLRAVKIVARKNSFDDFAEAADRAIAEITRLRNGNAGQVLALRPQGRDITAEVRESLRWVVQDLNFRREGTGLDSDPLSPEMQRLVALLADLEAGRILCVRKE